MTRLDIEPLPAGRTLKISGVSNPMVFRSVAAAEDAARGLPARRRPLRRCGPAKSEDI